MQTSFKKMKKLLMKPLKALVSPGIYLFGKYSQYKRDRQEPNLPMPPTENELSLLNNKIDKLLSKMNGNYVEMASSPEEECVICVNAKAVMQTYPCGHKVVCRRCFVKTIQIALAQRTLPLRCVICRAKILRLRQTQACKLIQRPSYSFYSRSCCRTSKRPSQLMSSSCSFKNNPWPGGSKYSKSLPGIGGSNSSIKYRSYVNRSYSTVVYRKSSTNSMRKCCRSCSLSSYSLMRSNLQTIPMHSSQPANLRQDRNIGEVDITSPSQEVKDVSLLRRKQSGSLSRDELIHQFQRDFREGQLSARPVTLRNKSFTLPRPVSASSDVPITPKCDMNKHPTSWEKSAIRDFENTAVTNVDGHHKDKSSVFKMKDKMKACKLLKLERKDKSIKCQNDNSKGNKSVKKDKLKDKRSVKSK